MGYKPKPAGNTSREKTKEQQEHQSATKTNVKEMNYELKTVICLTLYKTF